MKKTATFILCIAIALQVCVASSATHAPPPGEKVKTELVSKTDFNCGISETTYYNVVALDVCDLTYLTESVSEAMPVSAIVCPTVARKVAEVDQHDFGIWSLSSNYESILHRILYRQVIHLPDLYVMRC